MTFWDTSGIVPLLVEEFRSTSCRALVRNRRGLVVWCMTRVEATSAMRRLQREGALDAKGTALALRRLDGWARRWTEVEALDPTRERAERLLGAYPLKAADALQLAAALVAVRERPRGHGFVTADGPLADAARAEGFDVVVPGGRP